VTLSSSSWSRAGRCWVTWYRTAEQLPINVGDATYDLLLPDGWGLRTDPARDRFKAQAAAGLGRRPVEGGGPPCSPSRWRTETGPAAPCETPARRGKHGGGPVPQAAAGELGMPFWAIESSRPTAPRRSGLPGSRRDAQPPDRCRRPGEQGSPADVVACNEAVHVVRSRICPNLRRWDPYIQRSPRTRSLPHPAAARTSCVLRAASTSSCVRPRTAMRRLPEVGSAAPHRCGRS
jgi:hypothetical protein